MPSLIPMLPVRHLPVAIDFYQRLGFTIMQREDAWRWAMLAFGDSRLMLDESINPPPATPHTGVLYLYPDDIRQYHANLASKGLAVPALETTFYGMVEFRLADPDGNQLWIGGDAGQAGRSA